MALDYTMSAPSTNYYLPTPQAPTPQNQVTVPSTIPDSVDQPVVQDINLVSKVFHKYLDLCSYDDEASLAKKIFAHIIGAPVWLFLALDNLGFCRSEYRIGNLK